MPAKRNPRCVIFGRWKRPDVIWRWYRRIVFFKLNRRIKNLSKDVQALADKPDPEHKPFVIMEDWIDPDVPRENPPKKKAG